MKNDYLVYCWKIIFLFLFLMGEAGLYAQTPVSVKGKVSISEGSGYYVVVVSSDYKVLASEYYETPEFHTPEVSARNFIVQIYSPLTVGTQSFPLENEKDESIIDLGVIALGESTQLQTVSVVARRSRSRTVPGKMIHTVEHNNEFQSMGSAVEILKHIPLVTVEKDKVNIFGKKNTLVLVNGQPARDDSWTFISPENIREIEVSANPPAEYAAEGAAVINIITRRKAVEGFNGQAFVSLAKGEYRRMNNRLQLAYATSKINLYTNGAYNPETRLFVEGYERNFSDGTEMQNELRQKRKTADNYNFLAGGDYNIGQRQTVGLQYRYIRQGAEKSTDNRTVVTGSADRLSRFSTNTFASANTSRHIYDLTYTFAVDSLGKRLSAGIGYVDYLSEENTGISELTDGLYHKDKRSASKANVGLFTANADYEHKTSRGYVFKTGLYFSRSDNDSYYSLYRLAEEEAELDPDFSNGTRIRENKAAAYLTARKTWTALVLSVGIRYEQVGYKSTERRTTYRDFFPSVEVGYTFGEKFRSELSYSRKINRPAFKDLDPSSVYVDSLTYFVGNTGLRPEYSHNLVLNLVYNRYFTFSLGYSRIQDPIYMTVRRLRPDTKVCIATTENLDDEDRWTFSVSAPYQYKGWTTYHSLGIQYNRNRYRVEDFTYDNRKTMFYALTSHNFRLPAGVELFFSYQYNSRGRSGIFSFRERHIFNCGASLSCWQDKLTLTVRYDDVFHQDYMSNHVDLTEVDLVYRSKYDASCLHFSLRYKFGKSARSYRVKDNTAEELKRIQ